MCIDAIVRAQIMTMISDIVQMDGHVETKGHRVFKELIVVSTGLLEKVRSSSIWMGMTNLDVHASIGLSPATLIDTSATALTSPDFVRI